jgi:dTDP-4-amino-4,6-dideoxygalactose transaminase
MNDINAMIGLCNINEANASVLKQRENSKYLIHSIKNVDVITPEFDDTTSFWLFSMHVLNERKQEFINYLKDNEIASSPVHYRNDLYDCTIKYKEEELPGVTSFDETQVCIPNGWWLSDDELNHIINTIERF